MATKLASKRTKALKKSKISSKASFQANKRAKTAFFNNVNATMNNPNLSPKRKFNILLKLMKNNKVSTTPPLIENDDTINDPKTKSNLFNEHFASKSKVCGNNDASPILDKIQNIDSLSSLNTSPYELSKILEDLKKSNFSHCGVPGKFLSMISFPISEPLSKLFNNLFTIGYFPDIWKIAHITAIYKKSGQKSDKSNYRPISLLPTLSKVFESVIHQRLLNHLTLNNLISERQAAYMKGDSTISQLIYLVHTIRNAWGQGSIAQGVFLDISSAFDKVWHKGLLAKLLQIRVEDTAFNLFQSYLSNRKQVVVVEGTKSETLDVEAGVPQGSRLGPLLFIIFINDLTNDLESEITIFADDTTLLATGKDPNITAQILNRDLIKISEWAARWKVTFNAKKSKDMIFSRKMLYNSFPTILNETVIDRVSVHKHLGLILTSNLDWSPQVHEVCLKANRKLAVLKSVKLLSRRTLDQLYKITVRSVIDYALPVYFKNVKQTDMVRLVQVQYNAAKLVSGALHYSSIEKLNKELGWETIQDRAEYLGITFFHKIHLHETRPLIQKYMPKIKSDQHDLRSNGGYEKYPNYGVHFYNSFFPHFSKTWNLLPTKLRRLNLKDFKQQVASNFKPKRYKHFSRGSKLSNTLLTRIRLGRSDLNAHKFSIGATDNPHCVCLSVESSAHYTTECTLYTSQRQTMYGLFDQYIPHFQNMTNKKKHEIILQGYKPETEDYLHTNTKLTFAVQKFILDSKRFS